MRIGGNQSYCMASLKTKVLAIAFVLGIAATGVTLAAGVTNTGGLGVADVDQEPLQVGEIDADEDITFVSDNGEVAEVNQFTTAEGASVFDASVSGIDGGNEFTVTTPLNNTADDSLYMVISVDTTESLSIQSVDDDGDLSGAAGDLTKVESDGQDSVTYVAEFEPDTDEGFNEATVDFNFLVNNDAAANDIHEFEIDYQFEERSPGQT